MNTDTIVFWNICLIAVAGLVVTLKRIRASGQGWAVLYLAILVVDVAGNATGHPALIYTSAVMWLVLVLLPGLLGRTFQRRFYEQRYDLARRWALVISWLHPADGWRQQPEILRALELTQKGDLPAAVVILERLKGLKSVIGISAILHFYRITHRWSELLAWEFENKPNLDRLPEVLPTLLRARGETGDIKGLVALYSQYQHRIAKIRPPASRDMCRLMVFAFTGKRAPLERLLAGSLALIPQPIRTFWLATANLAAGDRELARCQLESILPDADPSFRRAVEQRLAQISIPPVMLDPQSEAVIENVAREQHHDDRFGAQRTLFSKAALATQILIVLNLIMFGMELWFGGSENFETLFNLGAMFAPAVLAGQWWRLGSALFLHFGVLHLAMNMFALWVLGPYVEYALGSRRFLGVYLTAGIGSMALVLALSHNTRPDQFTVGASGAIMGLIGATGALMLRGWLHEKASAAKTRLNSMLLILVLQTVFDAMIPQVSMTAHLSGAIIGFLATLACRDRLRSVTA